ncbi:MAG: hypothetical protein QOH25_1844 [Acidobacteriota bacterium]|nr:hypothetical protein [Acidobacteriota bacterium]
MKDAILTAVFILSSDDNLLSTWNCVEHDNAILVSFFADDGCSCLDDNF